MRNFWTALICTLALWGAAPAMAEDYETGYVEVAADKSAEPELRLFMSYWCGHCFAMRDLFSDLREHYAGRVRFVINPINMLGGADAIPAQRGYALAHLQGVSADYNRQIFDLVQVKEKHPLEETDFVAIFHRLGVPESVYREEIASFVITKMVEEFDAEAERINLDAVPTLVVNGRYAVNIGVFDRLDHAIAVIDHLLSKD